MLEQVNWTEKSTSHSETSANLIPKYIKQLTSDDLTVATLGYENLKKSLIGNYIYGTASPTSIPFLINLIESSNDNAVKFVLWLFDEMLQVSELKADQSIQSEQHRLMLETGQEIAKGLDIYLELLKHPNYLVRIATGKLVFYWFRFPKYNEHKIKTYFRKFKACETHPLVKQNIANWFEP